MNRKELDMFVDHYGLSRAAIRAALDVSNAQPRPDELERFAVRLLLLAGVLSVAAGVVFFIAANWDALAVSGRFALVQAALAVSVAGALWRPPPHGVGRNASLMAFIMTGALLALFGQTYQTGADVYELFLTWALIGLPFVVAAQWSVAWAAWLLVLNVALLLFCGWRPEAGWLWIVFSAWRPHPSLLLLAPVIPNLLAWLASERLDGTGASLAPAWLGRFALACAVGFATWSGAIAIFGDGYNDASVTPRGSSLLVVSALLAGIAAYAMHKRRDVFPLAAVAGSAIALSTFALVKNLGFGDIGMFFVLALWLIASSTVSGQLLMRRVRAWRRDGVES